MYLYYINVKKPPQYRFAPVVASFVSECIFFSRTWNNILSVSKLNLMAEMYEKTGNALNALSNVVCKEERENKKKHNEGKENDGIVMRKHHTNGIQWNTCIFTDERMCYTTLQTIHMCWKSKPDLFVHLCRFSCIQAMSPLVNEVFIPIKNVIGQKHLN